MTAKLCGEGYRRPSMEVLSCHYLAGHPAEKHSWWTVLVADHAEDIRPVPDAEAVLAALLGGRLDPFLEAILAGAHARKRQLRGVPHPHGLVVS